MASDFVTTFFDHKRPWSRYKDTVLDYYLTPYLEKIKMRRVGITVVDMFAGRGEFKSGEPGSPLIIKNHLSRLVERGLDAQLLCYETTVEFVAHLHELLHESDFAHVEPVDCFSQINRLSSLANERSLLLYIDPCDVNQIGLSRLAPVFEKIHRGSSVEILLVFMTRAFMRQAGLVFKKESLIEELGAIDDPLIRDADESDKEMWLHALYGTESSEHTRTAKMKRILNDVAGGEYWVNIAKDDTLSGEEKGWEFMARYCDQLRHRWFEVAETFPIYADTQGWLPKYWIVYATRYAPGFDIFNRAACHVVREQRKNVLKSGGLFADIEPVIESANPMTVDREVKRVAKIDTPLLWKKLRWRTCRGRNIGRFTDSEVNASIKRLLKEVWLSGASHRKISDESQLTSTDKLDSWVDG